MANEEFGTVVALWGNTVLLGLPSSDEETGAVLRFERAAGTSEWKVVEAWGPTGADLSGSRFGASLALWDNTALVAAPGHRNAAGTVFVYGRDSVTGTWSVATTWTPVTATTNGRFGTSLALWDDAAAVSHNKFHSDGVGHLDLYVRDTKSQWRTDISMSFDASIDEGGLGAALAGHRNRLAIGAPHWQAERGSSLLLHVGASNGDPCDTPSYCWSLQCVDGFCCDKSCEQPCDRCDIEGSQGTCTIVADATRTAPTCSPYLCDGDQATCPSSCTKHADCGQEFACVDLRCQAKRAPGASCTEAEHCSTGYCVEGRCCDGACTGSCERCDLQGREGTCSLLPHGYVGSPSCSPYRCDGVSPTCPLSCSTQSDCTEDTRCRQESCESILPLGTECIDSVHCGSGFCTDGVCCTSATCGDFRCRSDGSCAQNCTSSAECAPGLSCTSTGDCEPLSATNTETSNATCSMASSPREKQNGWAVLLPALAVWLFRRGKPV